jgi:hypothetical protein
MTLTLASGGYLRLRLAPGLTGTHLGATKVFRLLEHRLGSVASMKPGSGTRLIMLSSR